MTKKVPIPLPKAFHIRVNELTQKEQIGLLIAINLEDYLIKKGYCEVTS